MSSYFSIQADQEGMATITAQTLTGCNDLLLEVSDAKGRRHAIISIATGNHILAGTLAQAINSVTAIQRLEPLRASVEALEELEAAE